MDYNYEFESFDEHIFLLYTTCEIMFVEKKSKNCLPQLIPKHPLSKKKEKSQSGLVD